MRRVIIAALMSVMVSPSFAGELPKCRNVAGYEPKPTCEARNQRAQWQAEYTAKVTAQLMAENMRAQAEADKMNDKSIGEMVSGAFDSAVSTVSGLFQ